MRKMFNDKKNLIAFALVFLGVILLLFSLFYKEKENKLDNTLDAIENIFFFLPNDKYDNLNDISDYCKISLIYGSKFLKSDKLINKDNYDADGKLGSLKAYSKDNVLKSLKKLLGDDASINFDLNDDSDYDFLMEDGCRYANNDIKALSYNETDGYIFSVDRDEDDNIELFVKWGEPNIENDQVIIHASALVAVKNGDDNYDIFADKDLKHLAGTTSKFNLTSEVEKLYYKSMDYVFTLKIVDGNYIWTNYEVIDRLYDEGFILD